MRHRRGAQFVGCFIDRAGQVWLKYEHRVCASESEMKHCGRSVAYVTRDAEGLEWFICAAHADLEPARWTERTPIVEWFRARSLAMPDTPRPCNEARIEPSN
jgi:hypothetical protein